MSELYNLGDSGAGRNLGGHGSVLSADIGFSQSHAPSLAAISRLNVVQRETGWGEDDQQRLTVMSPLIDRLMILMRTEMREDFRLSLS